MQERVFICQNILVTFGTTRLSTNAPSMSSSSMQGKRIIDYLCMGDSFLQQIRYLPALQQINIKLCHVAYHCRDLIFHYSSIVENSNFGRSRLFIHRSLLTLLPRSIFYHHHKSPQFWPQTHGAYICLSWTCSSFGGELFIWQRSFPIFPIRF